MQRKLIELNREIYKILGDRKKEYPKLLSLFLSGNISKEYFDSSIEKLFPYGKLTLHNRLVACLFIWLKTQKRNHLPTHKTDSFSLTEKERNVFEKYLTENEKQENTIVTMLTTRRHLFTEYGPLQKTPIISRVIDKRKPTLNILSDSIKTSCVFKRRFLCLQEIEKVIEHISNDFRVSGYEKGFSTFLYKAAKKYMQKLVQNYFKEQKNTSNILF